MKSLKTLVLLFASNIIFAQTTADFENFNLPVGSYDNDAGDSSFFGSGNILLPNEYVDDPSFPYWNGWSISSMTDVITPGFNNQYSCIAGEGAEDSDTYALGYVFGSLAMHLTGDAQGGVVQGIYLNNSTYAYLSMLEGDLFAKKFGGESGNDPDFFKLTIRKKLNGVIGADSVEFYLADYRFADNNLDYIVKEWTYLDLSSLGNADLLEFTVASSDIGVFGINTPTYFCIDNVTTTDTPSATKAEAELLGFKVWPNPVSDLLQIEWAGQGSATACLSDIYGKKIAELTLAQGQNSLEVSDLPPGMFTLQMAYHGRVLSQIFVKN
jgi:Domain of unknown function (DUF4465)/Secretion system C-terminal sorting domain